MTISKGCRIFCLDKHVTSSNIWTKKDFWKSPEFDRHQIRLVIFKDHDLRGRQLLFDSVSMQRIDEADSEKKIPRPSSDVKMLSEMMFGSVAMSYKGPTLKVHTIRTPPQLMVTKVFMPVRHSAMTESYDANSLQGSGPDIMTSRIPRPISGNGRNAENVQIARSIPMDVPMPSPKDKQISSQLDEDSGLAASFASSGSWTPGPSPHSSSASNNSNSFTIRWMRSRATMLEYGPRKRYSLDDQANSQASNGDAKLPPNIKYNQRASKVGLCIVFSLPEETIDDPKNRNFQKFFFSHITLIEGHVNKLKKTVEAAYCRKHNFVPVVNEALEKFRSEVYDLYLAPRLNEPIWLSMVSYSSSRLIVCQHFLKEFISLVDRMDTKANNFFISTLLTGVLTNHLAWVPTVTPAGAAPSVTYNDKHTAKWLDTLAKSHPYNPLWAQLGDLYGAIGFPAKLSRTVIVGKRADLVCKLLYILSYFIRCSEVQEVLEQRLYEETDDIMDDFSPNDDLQFETSHDTPHEYYGSSHNTTSESVRTLTSSPLCGGSQLCGGSHLYPDLNQDDLKIDLYLQSGVSKTGDSITTETNNTYTDSGPHGMLQNHEPGYDLKYTDSGPHSNHSKQEHGFNKIAQSKCHTGGQCNNKENSITEETNICNNCTDMRSNFEDNREPLRDIQDKVKALMRTKSPQEVLKCPQNKSEELKNVQNEKTVNQAGLLENKMIDSRENSDMCKLAENDIAETRNVLKIRHIGKSAAEIRENLQAKLHEKQTGFDNEIDSELTSINENLGRTNNIGNKSYFHDNIVKPKDVSVDGSDVVQSNTNRQIPLYFRFPSKEGMFDEYFEDVPPVHEIIKPKALENPVQNFARVNLISTVTDDVCSSSLKNNAVTSGVFKPFEKHKELEPPDTDKGYGSHENETYTLPNGKHMENVINDNTDEPVLLHAGPKRPSELNVSTVIENNALQAKQSTVQSRKLEGLSLNIQPNIKDTTNSDINSQGSQRPLSSSKSVKTPCRQDSDDSTATMTPGIVQTPGSGKRLERSTSVDPTIARLRTGTPTDNTRRRHLSSVSTQSYMSEDNDPFLNLRELPMPMSDQDETTMQQIETNFGHSLLAGYSDHYMSDFVLHGTSDTKFEGRLMNDLAMSAQHPVLDEPAVEALCVIGDTDKCKVKVMSHSQMVRGRQTVTEVMPSQMILSLVESTRHMCSMKMPPEFCLMHLEDCLQEIYFKSKTLAEYLKTNKRTHLKDLTTILGCDQSDLPVLLAVAGTHSPNLNIGLLQ